MRTVTTTLDSPVGVLTLTARDGRLTGLHMSEQAHPPAADPAAERDDDAFGEIAAQLAAYFAGELTSFDIPLDPVGTEFQRRVWNGLRAIPFGQTRSYAQLAASIGNARACRAVGLANGRNPIAIVIPCHRVIAADGTLGGYGGGLARKTFLLELERRVAGGAMMGVCAAAT